MQRIGRFALILFEIGLLTVLIVTTRCANYQDVFVAGNIYFVDADCYARMTRAQMVREKPWLIIRRHAFENFPQGTTSHTTAPLDYLIVALSFLLNPFTAHALDLAGAFVSPLLALLGAWFLWWWSRRMKFRYRWVMLILYAISPILVHGTALGRPDHQSLLILLVAIAICAGWSSQTLQPTNVASAWRLTSAAAWALAIWVSAYEPLVLFLIVMVTAVVMNPRAVFARDRRAGWILFAAIIAIAFALDLHVPSFEILQSTAHLKNWASTIGELAHVAPMNPVWLNWCGYLLVITPIFIWMSVRTRRDDAQGLHALPVICVLLITTYFLTIWQARWGYFFVLIFALALPALLAPMKSNAAVWIAFVLSMFPILGDWDERLWPNEAQLADRVERRIESVQIRDLALSLRSPEVHPFLAPWWLSPSIAYWSGQPGVTGSSHESLNGIVESARFFLSENLEQAHDILDKHRVAWVFAYDSQRLGQNSAAILNEAVPPRALCRLLYETPSQAPPFLIFSAQNPTCKLYRVAVER
ncbi:MAG: hypothetical protein WA849_05920 [Candidatus Udaeobacter sp.]